MKISKYILLIGVLASIVGCGGTKVTEKGKPTVDNKVVMNNNKEVVASKKIKKENNGSSESKSQKQIAKKITRKRIIRSDSTYALLFYDKQGNLSGKYDIWENNPFKLTTIKKFYKGKVRGSDSEIYKLPGLRKNELKGKVPLGFYLDITENVSINKIAIVPNISNKGEKITAVSYTIVALEDYPEEYTNQGIYSKVQIVDNNTSKVLKEIEITQKAINRYLAITQDGKYLVYVYSTEENNEGCFDVYDLNREKIVYTKCVEIGFELSGAYLSTNYTIGLSISDFRNIKKKEIYIVSSKTGYIYSKKFYPQYGNYEVYDFGIVKNNRKDTLLFQTEFHSIKL